MRRGRAATAAVILSLAFQSVPLAAQPVVDAIAVREPEARLTIGLPPTSAWAADFAADNCSLTRTFGDASGSVTLRFRQFAPEDGLEVTVASQAFALDPDDPHYSFAAGAPRDVEFFQQFRVDGGVQGAIFQAWSDGPLPNPASLPPFASDDPALRAADRFAVLGLFDRNIVLQTGSLRQPMTVLTSCLDDLMTSWGLDAVAHHALTKPVTDRDRDDTWPGGSVQVPAIGQWPNDLVEFRLLVDEAGKITDCRVLNGLPENESLGRAICSGLDRPNWRFDPARDSNGQPIKSYHMARFIKSRT